MSNLRYFVVPSDDKGDYPADTVSNKDEAQKLANQLYQEFKSSACANFRVDVWTGFDQPESHLDPVYTVK